MGKNVADTSDVPKPFTRIEGDPLSVAADEDIIQRAIDMFGVTKIWVFRSIDQVPSEWRDVVESWHPAKEPPNEVNVPTHGDLDVLSPDQAAWLSHANQILEGKFDRCDDAALESLTIGLRAIKHPLCEKALARLKGNSQKSSAQSGSSSAASSTPPPDFFA
jgi:hypothetical protein